MSSVAAFPQPLYAKGAAGEQLIVLALTYTEGYGISYIVMINDAGHEKHGKPFRVAEVTFEHFYWPEIEPSDQTEFTHPQEPALKIW